MINLRDVSLGYGKKKILDGLTLQIDRGEFVGIIGLSGAGKSTLLSSLIGNVKVLSGSYLVADYRLERISKNDLKELRGRIGFIFQGYNLIDRLSVLHNIMSGMLRRIPLTRSIIKLYSNLEFELAREYMQVVGIEELALQRCDTLSGGQRQRVAIARALAQDPEILLADEPVAALDPVSASQVMEVLKKINASYQTTVIANLHHLDFARDYCSRIIGIAAGKIVFDGPVQLLDQESLDRIYGVQDLSSATEEVLDLSHLYPIADRLQQHGQTAASKNSGLQQEKPNNVVKQAA